MLNRAFTVRSAVLCLAATTALCTVHAFADDKMMSGMTEDQMMKMKDMMGDDSKMSMMKDEEMKMMTMDKMAKDMAADPKFQEQMKSMMSDPGMMKMMKDEKADMMDMKMTDEMKQKIMSDPHEMHMVMMKAMMMSDPEMKKMMMDDGMKKDDMMK